MQKLLRSLFSGATALLMGISLVACGGGGGSSSILNVTATDSISIGCTGNNCAAINATTYGGSGTGVWKYNNSSSASTVSLNIDIAGVSAGKQVTFAFSNGGISSASAAPQTGSQASTDLMQSAEIYATQADRFSKLSQQQIQRHHAHEQAHGEFLEQNSGLAQRIKSGQKTTLFDPKKSSLPSPAPLIGSTRTWVDYWASPSASYPSTNQFNCSLPNGRNVVFWKSNTDSSLTTSILNTFASSVCGNNKGFHQLIELLGDAWGSHSYSDLINDSTMQDINIAFVNPPSNTGWTGYFWGRNNYISTPSYLTNSALVFFVNTNSIASDVNFYISTLIHEAKHMIGFYQNDMVLDKTTDTWFEETGAMMAEDIVIYGLTGYNKIKDYRLPAYMQTGGNVSLNNWPSLSSNNYAMGGAFGAFLNRRYGTNLLTQSFTQCTGGSAKTSSYDCVNGLIASNGGVGLADELARMGASIHSKLPALGNPSGYGYPAVTSNGFSLSAIDTSTMMLAAPNSVTSYSSMSQTYLNETIAAGKTRYIRNGVLVPAGTSFYLTIK
jgi:Peptidase M30